MPPDTALGTRRFTALGTSAHLLVTDPAVSDRACALLTGELDAIDRACSRFRPDSELWRVNHARGRTTRISALLAEAVAVALAAAQVTDGDVDPTCGRSLARLGYDRDFAAARQNTSPLSQPPVPAAGWQAVELDSDRHEITVPGDVVLDLGATAKALAADRAAVRISASLNCGTLVNLGGDIRAAGASPDGGWCIGIVDNRGFDGAEAAAGGPEAGGGDAAGGPEAAGRPAPPGAPRHDAVVVIRDGGLATSSSKVRAWSRGTTPLHHIIVPATGMPADSCWRTVSVAAATCVDANTASTAAIIRGERAPGWLARQRLPARLVGHGGEIVTVAGWPAGTASRGTCS
jgi:thiamine biosynthesis lipoprotein